MSDRICGHPSNLTVVSNNGAGFVRVTYAPWELDWEWFNTITVGADFLANTTTVVSAGITAKGGAENLGYWFDINQAFPSANWNTGDRMTPQRQAAINQYASMTAAVAAMAANDTLLIWYYTTTNLRVWSENVTMSNLGGNIWGMLSRKQIINLAGFFRIIGNLLAQNQQAIFVNLCSYASSGFIYQPTAGQAGAGLRGKRLAAYGNQSNAFIGINHTAGTVEWENSIAVKAATAFNGGIALNCAALFCATGFTALNANLRNLVAAECNTCFSGGSLAGAQNCADTDGTLPVHATNLRNQNMRTQLKFFYDLARPGNKAFPWDARIHYDSVLRAAGVNAGVVVDADGQARPNPPAIGPYEPYPTCYAPSAVMIKGAAKREVEA